MHKQKKRNDGEMQYRFLDFTRDMVKEDGSIELSCSSEAPVTRWWGVEILGHGPGEIRLDRTKAVGSFLFAHGRDPNYGYVPLGPIDDVWLDEAERRTKAICRFDDDEKSQIMKNKANSGSIRGVSIGYKVYKWLEVAPGVVERGVMGPCEIAVDWEILEISLEPVAADPSVGVGRSEDELEAQKSDAESSAVAGTKQDPPVAEENKNRSDAEMGKTEQEIREEAVRAERERISSIRALVQGIVERMPDIKIDENELLRTDVTVDQARERVLKIVTEYMQPVSQGASAELEVTRDETEKFRTATVSALAHRAGIRVAPAEIQNNEYRGMTLLDLCHVCYERKEGKRFRGYDRHELVRSVINNSDLPLILGNTANKALQTSYQLAPTTYQIWCKIGNLVDYKPTSRIQISEAPLLDEVKAGGEYNYAEMKESGEVIQLKKYGKLFSLTREMIINDDLQALVDIPQKFGVAARMTCNKLVYAVLTGNPTMADGKPLFHADHGANLEATAAYKKAPSVATLEQGFKVMGSQKGLQDEIPLNIVPGFIITPLALKFTVLQLLKSTVDPSKNNSTNNPFEGQLIPVAEPLLDLSSTTAWYLAAAPGIVDTVEVAFLNGNDAPFVDQQEGFNVDGVTYKVRHEFGIKALDYRGLYNNPGA